jgi:lambda repressor-like predicted transcriptional regulator
MLRTDLGLYCINDQGCYNRDGAKDYLCAHCCSIFDLLKEAYSNKIAVWLWEEEIVEEALRNTLECWDNFNGVYPPSSMWRSTVLDAIAQHLGRPIRKSTRPAPASPPAYSALLTMPQATVNQAAVPEPVEQHPKQNAREAFVLPILETKGWSILDWSNEAEVAYHTAADYLEGKTRPYRSSRLKMAKALGITVQQLPR